MNKLLLVTFILFAASAQADWVDLFQFPFLDTPLQIMMGISCLGKDQCWITGGNTNTAFGIYKNTDAQFSNVTKCNVSSIEPPILLLSVAMADENQGVAGGVEIGEGGTYYTFDGQDFNSSLEVGMVQTQALYSLGNGKYAFVGLMNGRQGVAVSKTDGILFTGKWFPKDFRPEAPARYGSFPSDNVWYVTGGDWPQTDEAVEGTYHDISAKLRYHADKGKFEQRQRKSGDVNGTYTALIAKTTDGGETWVEQFYDEGNFYFNGIDCISEDICMAVAEGFVNDGGQGGARVFKTTNGGANWTQIYVYGEETGGSGIAINMLSETEAWVATTSGTSLLNQGAFFSHTTDGGETWTQSAKLGAVGDVTAMSFIDDNTAYAIAVTDVQLSTVLAMGVEQKEEDF